MSEVDEGAGLRPELTLIEDGLAGIVARDAAFDEANPYDYGRDEPTVGLIRERRFLLRLLREARAHCETGGVWLDESGFLERTAALRAEGSDPQVGHQTIEAQEDR